MNKLRVEFESQYKPVRAQIGRHLVDVSNRDTDYIKWLEAKILAMEQPPKAAEVKEEGK